MTVNLQLVEQLNAKAKALNAERQRMLGQQEAARLAYEKAVLVYKQKYGVQLDDTNIQQEYDTVSAQLQADYEKLNALVLSIESGEYKNNQAALVVPSIANSAQPQGQAQAQSSVQAQPTSPQAPFGQPSVASKLNQSFPAPGQFGVAQEAANSAPKGAPLSPADLAAATAAAVGQQATEIPSGGRPAFPQPAFGQSSFGQSPFGQPQPQAQPTPQVQSNPQGQPSANPQNSGEQQDVSEQAFTPPGWGTPKKDINATFGGILGNNGNGMKFS